MKKITLFLLLIVFPQILSSQEIKIGQSAEEIKYIVGTGATYLPNTSWDVEYKNGKISSIILCHDEEYLIDIGVVANFCKYFIMEKEKLAYILTQYENLSVNQIKKYYDNMEDKIKGDSKYYDRDYAHFSNIYLHENGLATVEWRKNLNVDNNLINSNNYNKKTDESLNENIGTGVSISYTQTSSFETEIEKGYVLNGRKLNYIPVVKNDCNETGIIMVQIMVNQFGEVKKVVSGTKGSTSLSKCLIEEAERISLNTIWNKDLKAPQEQIGYLKISF